MAEQYGRPGLVAIDEGGEVVLDRVGVDEAIDEKQCEHVHFQ